MKNVVFWDIKTHLVLHRRDISSQLCVLILVSSKMTGICIPFTSGVTYRGYLSIDHFNNIP
jgi:hypothetical protein